MSVILREIIPESCKLQFQWSRDRCTRRYDSDYQSEYWLKDLKKVKRAGYDLDRVLIVDDESIKIRQNYGNSIYVASFEGDQNDTELDLLGMYLSTLASVDHVRTIEKRNWRSTAKALKAN